MPACTIFALKFDPGKVAEKLKLANKRWIQLTIKTRDGKIRLASLRWTRGGDRASKILLGTGNFFDKIKTKHVKQKKKIVNHIYNSTWIIGVTSEGDAFSDEMCSIIFSVAAILKAKVFTGSAMLNATGKLLLDADGKSEIPLK